VLGKAVEESFVIILENFVHLRKIIHVIVEFKAELDGANQALFGSGSYCNLLKLG